MGIDNTIMGSVKYDNSIFCPKYYAICFCYTNKIGSQMSFLFTKITKIAVLDSIYFVEFCNQNYPFDFMMKIFTFPYQLPFIYFAYICEKRNRINA